MNNKKCCTCNEFKDLTEFCKCKNQKDGLNRRCRKCVSECCQKYKEKNKPSKKAYMETHRNDKAAYDKIYRQKNKDKIAGYKKDWHEKTKHKIEGKIKRNLRRRIHHVLKGDSKSAHTMELLGCDIDFFLSYLESQFQEGMTWENYGLGENKWHVDHIKPCAAFDLKIEANQRECFHYSNMRPLWEKDNLKKSYIFEGVNCRITKIQ